MPQDGLSLEQLLCELIEFRTVSEDYVANKQALEWIIDQLKGLPVYIDRIEVDRFPSVVIKTQPTMKSVICLHSHLDVFKDKNDEKKGFFTPRKMGRRLFGRGAYDMKFALACYLYLMKELGQELRNFNLSVIVPTDEELGGFKGTKVLLEKGYSSNVCFSPDGGSNWRFEIAAKGVLQIQVKSTGRSTHGSRPWDGDNAIVKLMDFLRVLGSHFQSEPCNDSDHNHTSFNIGTISGGSAVNQVPAEAEAKLDIRFVPEQPREDIWRLLRGISESFPGIELEESAYGPNYTADPTNSYFRGYSLLLRDILGVKEAFVCSHGSSDARFFVERNIPVISIRPPGGGLHSDDEWIDLEGLEQFYHVLKAFVTDYAKIS